MSWIAEAHRQWHSIHGDVVCPLDCGIGEGQYYFNEDTGEWEEA